MIGTFKNGYLQGTATLHYLDNTTLISNFEKGFPIGMKRSWTSNNKLKDLSFWDQQYVKWTRISNFLIGRNASFIHDPDLSWNYVLVPLDISKEILAGSGNLVMGYAEEIYGVDVIMNSKKHDCFMDLKVNIREKKEFKLIFDGDIQIPHSKYSTKSDLLCKKDQPKYHSIAESRGGTNSSMFANCSIFGKV